MATGWDAYWAAQRADIIARRRTATLECDCCGAEVPGDQIAVVIAYGIETAACARCRGCEDEAGT